MENKHFKKPLVVKFCTKTCLAKKKSSDQKMTLLKVVQNFTKWGTIFFSFDKISKGGFYSQKTLLLKGAKNHRVKKVIKSKND